MKHKTAGLTGADLDAAVALAEGRLVTGAEPEGYEGEYLELRAKHGGKHLVRCYNSDGDEDGWAPMDWSDKASTDWAIGGPIIERERMRSSEYEAEQYPGQRWHYWTPGGHFGHGPTPLIAAMRAFVASKLGEEVELP